MSFTATGVLSWDVNTVCRWLTLNNMPHCAATFQAHEINGVHLLDLASPTVWASDLVSEMCPSIVDRVRVRHLLHLLRQTLCNKTNKPETNCIKVTGEKDETRVVNVAGATSYEAILRKILAKFNINPTDAPKYYILVSVNAMTNSVNDSELVAICADPTRQEREKLCLRKRFLRSTYYKSSPASSVTLTPVEPSPSKEAVRVRKLPKTSNRPPSELISNNLFEYFPQKGVKEMERRISMRKGSISEESPVESEIRTPTGEGPTEWVRGALIGRGSFGSVYLALNQVTCELMAVKQVDLPSPGDKESSSMKHKMVEALQQEIELLKELKHPNVVRYLGSSYTDANKLNIFLEYIPGGSVFTSLRALGPFPEPMCSSYLKQILSGIEHLHSRNIIHRDIKAANVLVDHDVLKISDFGISKRVVTDDPMSPPTTLKGHHSVALEGSINWMAPEVIKSTLYTKKSDIWSVGCLCLEMLTAKPPWPEMPAVEVMYKVGIGESPEIPHTTLDLQNLLELTFKMNRNERPTAEQLLQHPFVK